MVSVKSEQAVRLHHDVKKKIETQKFIFLLSSKQLEKFTDVAYSWKGIVSISYLHVTSLRTCSYKILSNVFWFIQAVVNISVHILMLFT